MFIVCTFFGFYFFLFFFRIKFRLPIRDVNAIVVCLFCGHRTNHSIKMSGHNPHGRVGHAVNSSQWNHLQVPPFISRQPQHAHMSNERPIRSPLAWHHSASSSAEALYGYMAAAAAAASSNHKSVRSLVSPCESTLFIAVSRCRLPSISTHCYPLFARRGLRCHLVPLISAFRPRITTACRLRGATHRTP